MRGHKFLILVGSYGDIEDYDLVEFDTPGIQVGMDDSYMEVVTCAHEKFDDNVVTLHGESYDEPVELNVLRDINGKLWYFNDHMSKLDIIKAFEQSDT